MLTLKLGRHEYPLDPAAVSAIRYRAAYGESVVDGGGLSPAGDASAAGAAGKLLRLCHMMIPAERRPELLEFARRCRKEKTFFVQALEAQRALLAPDPLHTPPAADGPAEPFDEYRVLAFLAAAGLDAALIYELPILHLAGVAQRVFELKQGGGKRYHAMPAQDRAALYPRRSRKGK